MLIDNYEQIKGKKIIIFICGLSDFTKTEHTNNIGKRLEKVIPKSLFDNIKVFYLRGSIDYKKLNVVHKIMMGLMKKLIMKKGTDKLTEEDREFLETYGKTIDFTDRKSIKEIIEYCKK